MSRLLLLALLVLTSPALALGPADIVIVANKNVPDSKAVADYYCAKRGVPTANVIYLDVPSSEDISRANYDTKIAKPLRDMLGPKRDKVKLVLTVYGVPLRVGATTPSAAEQAEAAKLQITMNAVAKERDTVYTQRKAAIEAAKTNRALEKQVGELGAKYNQLVAQYDAYTAKMRELRHVESVASVDSEVAGLWHVGVTDYRMYQLNGLYFRTPATQAKAYQPTLPTCRLDGPTVAITKGIVDQSIIVEAKGLVGKAYFDARGIKYNPKTEPSGNGYSGYDESMREAAMKFKNAGVPTTLDDKAALFPAGSCPDSAIYCGWYSHGNYIASNKFVPGAVAYHIASSEAITLRAPGAKCWCPNILAAGACATIGPVAEPYTIGFTKPAEFFGVLGTGATLSESYWLTQRFTSWKVVLVGDPLYRPFGRAPLWKLDTVKPSPLGSQ